MVPEREDSTAEIVLLARHGAGGVDHLSSRQTMRIAETRLGVSRLQDGTKVLTPFGTIGKVYKYSDAVYRRLSILMIILFGTSMVTLLTLIYLSYRIEAKYRIVEILVLIAVFLDVLRFITVTILVFRVEEQQVTPRMKVREDVVAFVRYASTPIIALLCVIELFLLLAISVDVYTGKTAGIVVVPWILLFHAGIYLYSYLKARQTR